MAQQQFGFLAFLVAITFLVMAIASCSSTPGDSATAFEARAFAPKPNGVPEFHGAHIGADTLRDRLDSE